MAKNRLYMITRPYAFPAEVLVIAGSKSEAKELSNRKYGSCESQRAKKVKFLKVRVLHMN